MKNKLKAGIMIFLTIAGLTACGNVEEKETVSGITEEIEITSLEQTSEAFETEDIKEEETFNTEMTMTEEEADPYMEFLAGREPLYFHNYMHSSYEGTFYEFEKGYTLDEIIDILKSGYGLEKEPTITYAEMDCGNDQIKELAVCFHGMNIYEPDDDSTLVYIIKNIDSELELCYEYETWARSYSTINYYGYYTSGGSNGATNHGYNSGYVDGSGNWNFINYTEEEMDIEQLSWNDTLGKIPEIAATKTYEGSIVFLTTNFEEIATEEDYYNVERFYSFDVYDPEYTDSDLYTTSVYQQIFDEAGVTVYSLDEIDNMILEREEELGITETIKNGPELIWLSE